MLPVTPNSMCFPENMGSWDCAERTAECTFRTFCRTTAEGPFFRRLRSRRLLLLCLRRRVAEIDFSFEELLRCDEGRLRKPFVVAGYLYLFPVLESLLQRVGGA